jgi:hypothetical protein
LKKRFLGSLILFSSLLFFCSTSIAQRLRNYNECLHGYSGCDFSRLTDGEKTQVQQAAHQRNYNNCLHGYSGCDPSKLTKAEMALVEESAKRRNYNSCLHGYSVCNFSRLTDDEKIQAQQAAHQRNYNNCLRGYSGCDPSKLTEAEKSPVQDSARQRNYNYCLHGYSGCDPSRLTETEKSVLSSRKNGSPPAETQSKATQNNVPRYYTNRDGERVQSPTYSNSIPSGATAECRDGSYSFSRHHQGTCSHHGGVARWLD